MLLDSVHPVTKHTANSSDVLFVMLMSLLGGVFVLLIASLLTADLLFTSPGRVWQLFQQPEIRTSIRLTFITCTIAAIAAVWIATPLAYLLSRYRFWGAGIVDTLVEVPLVLPPLVLGLSLLILFHLPIAGSHLENWMNQQTGLGVTYHWPAIILAQFTVACAFSIRLLRTSFDQIPVRLEEVARTLGCSRWQAFYHVTLPQAFRGIMTALTVSWARSMGEFGPILVFAGATRMKTEVLSTTVYLEMSVGQLESAVAVSLLMVCLSAGVILVLRSLRWSQVE